MRVAPDGNEEKEGSGPEEVEVELEIPDAGELEASVDLLFPEEKEERSNEDCDIITKRDGEEIEAKVKAVTQDEIEYKKCGREDGPRYTIDKSEVFMIKYPDGSKDVFEEDADEKAEDEEKERDVRSEADHGSSSGEESSAESEADDGADGAGIAGFVFSMLTLFLLIIFFATATGGFFWVAINFSILGIIFSGVGDSGWATAGLVLSILELLACLLILGLAIALVTA